MERIAMSILVSSIMRTSTAAIALSGLESVVREIPVEIVVAKDSGQARLVTRAIAPTPFAALRRTLPDTIPVRTLAPDATSSPGMDFCNTTGVRQTSPRALYPAMVVLDPTARGPSTPCTGAWGAGPARPRPGAPS